jgi:DNA-binding SARP family transcriptional activator
MSLTSASSRFRLELLGGFRVTADGTRDGVMTLTARQEELLAYLALHDDGPIRRQEIAGRLWPDSTDGQALTNLRREWHHLRDAWPAIEALVEAGMRTLALRTVVGAVLDVRAFMNTAARGLQGDRAALADAAAIYRGDVLPDFAAEWIEPIRELYRQQAVRVLEQLLSLHEHEQSWTAVIERARQLLQVDRLHEPAWCALMRAHARRGERATALHLYQACASALRRECGVEPSAATRRVHREILEGERIRLLAQRIQKTLGGL